MYPGLSLTGQIGWSYRIEFADSVSETTVGTPLATVTLTSVPYLWFDAGSAGRQKRFYRAVVLP